MTRPTFLHASVRPPLATEDQEAVERVAAQLRACPTVQGVIQRLKDYWLDAMAPDADHLARYDHEYEQAAYCGLMNTANDDPLYPRLHAFGRLAHRLGDYHIPATKSGHPNPDYIYRFAPLDGRSRYVLHGRLPPHRPAAFEVAVLTAEQAYQKNLSLHQIVVDDHGRFTIEIDPDPADGRSNHFPSNGETFQLLVRDVISDPAQQLPVALKLERRGPAPDRPPLPFEALVQNAERHIRKHIDDLIFVTRNFVQSHPANVFARPEIKRDSMWSVAQAYSAGNFQLTEDQALIIRLQLGGAGYAVVPVSDFWGGVGGYLDRSTYLGTGRAVADPDGGYTIVLSHQDPGVPNWVSTDGLHTGAMFIRWIGLSAAPGATSTPDLTVELVRLDDLRARLPESFGRVSPAERAAQQALWRDKYARVMG